MNNLTQQEIFDKSVSGVIQQGCPSVLPGTKWCRYRDGIGHSCAVGFLIDDKAYRSEFEGYGTDDDRVQHALELSGISLDRFRWLVFDLQAAHDYAVEKSMKRNADFITIFIEKARKVAETYSLEFKFGENRS